MSYWRLGEATGTVAANAVAGPAGRYLGGFRLGMPGAISANTAAALLGVNGYVSVPDAPVLDNGDAFTLEAWIKRAKTGTSQGLFAKGPKSYQVYLDATNRLVLRQSGVAEIARTTVALTDTAGFHHIAVTKSGATVRLYVDGVNRAGTVVSRTLASTTAALAIGAGSGYFNGTLDEVAIYDRALDATSIAAHIAARA